MTELRLAFLSSCTSEFLQQPLKSALEQILIRPSIWTGGFGQYRQDILNPKSELYEQNPAVIVLYLDGSDLFQEINENPFGFSEKARRDYAEDRSAETATLVDTLAQQLPRTTVLLNTLVVDPLNTFVGLEYNSEFGIQDVVASYNRKLSALAQRLPMLKIVDVASLAANIGFKNWYDSRMWYLARSRWSRTAAKALAELYAAAIGSSLGRVRKCVVVDLDNTLWGGIVGEDGLAGLSLGEDGIGRSYVEFQQELLNLYSKGVLLAVCSKNNPEDALPVIRHHPAMRLREQHFAAMRINWEDKASNLRALAEELNIGLDSFVFIDDNPVERSLISQALPEVLVPDWPADSGEYKRALLELSAKHFYKTRITAEDRRAGEAYRAQAERRKLQESAASLEDFHRTLEMRAKIGRADPFTVPRIAQLTQKTNQFNLTTRRYSEAQISSMAQDPNWAIWWLDLVDRFGPNGLVGVLLLRRLTSEAWAIDTFLLSCRVMGRTVEDAFLAVVAHEVDASRLVGEYRPTAKNSVVRDLYQRLGFHRTESDGDGQLWELEKPVTRLKTPAWFEIELVSSGLVSAAN